MEMSESTVIANIIKIRGIKGLTKREMASSLNINEASYGRLENGKIALSYNHLARIARKFEMSVIELIAYPKSVKYVDQDDTSQDPLEAVLQIKLRKDKREQVLKLVFGDNNLEILNR